MANIIIKIPNDKLSDFIDAYAWKKGYSEEITNPVTGNIEPNSETKTQFVNKMLIQYLKHIYREYKIKLIQIEPEIEDINITI